jgi:outer membrane protein
MKSIRKILFFSLFLFFFAHFTSLFAQKKMSLQECVDYALENSYSVKQKILERESKQVQLLATKTSIAPSVGANIGQSINFGRAQQADNLMINTSLATSNFSVGLNMDIFKGLRTHHQIESYKLDLEATLLDIESVKENIELTIIALYLQILLYKEIFEVLKSQVILSQEQVNRIEILVQNGKSSDAELYVAKSTLANDQVSVVEAKNSVRLSILDLAQLMNYPDIANFDIVTENIGIIDEILHNNVNVKDVVDNALENRPAIRAAHTRIEHAKSNIKVYQSGWYPTLGFNVSYGTGYYYRFDKLSSFLNRPFGTQFKENSGTSVGISLYVPVFDKLSTHYSVKQQRINIEYQKLQLEETKRNLIKEIEQAYVNAVASKEKYLASLVANTSSEVAFLYEELKFNAGTSTHFEFNDSKNRFIQAQSKLIQAKFDFLFRVKILEFYCKE